MSYFIVTSNEGGTKVVQIAFDELLERITPNKDGETYYGDKPEFLSEVPEFEGGYWQAGNQALLIIKGEIVVPKPVDVIKKYTLP